LIATVGVTGATWFLDWREPEGNPAATSPGADAEELRDWYGPDGENGAPGAASMVEGPLEPQTREWERQTNDPVAAELYSQAKRLIDGSVLSSRFQEDLTTAAALLTQVTERDPQFAAGFYLLAHAHDQLYFRFDRTPARRAAAKKAIDALRRLRPTAGHTHLAMAKHLYWVADDLERARYELEIAIRLLPEEAIAHLLLAYVARRQGRWEESSSAFLRASALDPQNPAPLQQLSLNYFNLRQFRQMHETMDRVVALAPGNLIFRAQRAAIEMHWHGDTGPVREFITQTLGPTMRSGPELFFNWFDMALHERDPIAARNAVALMPAGGCPFVDVAFPRSWCVGLAARLRNDESAAKAEFRRARDTAEQQTIDFPSHAGAFCALGMAEAALGNKEAAIRAGRRAVELEPISKDALDGPVFLGLLGVIYSWTGEMDLAIQQIDAATSVPSFWSYGTLKLHPYWDAMRSDPRFQNILQRLAPKD
jgi:tetratricopeptide (TPR) repeat protein